MEIDPLFIPDNFDALDSNLEENSTLDDPFGNNLNENDSNQSDLFDLVKYVTTPEDAKEINRYEDVNNDDGENESGYGSPYANSMPR